MGGDERLRCGRAVAAETSEVGVESKSNAAGAELEAAVGTAMRCSLDRCFGLETRESFPERLDTAGRSMGVVGRGDSGGHGDDRVGLDQIESRERGEGANVGRCKE
ncbi:hypothetical protein TRIUR3_26987 [Triticum urartu]|uniref:Uncharacterized protein n=1 Tax=Triticum urartu TaxID=4572 RepID=M7Z1X4_TRIUA|nr:hypothetical protein TRIUR3_26987 [Triticum urartu]